MSSVGDGRFCNWFFFSIKPVFKHSYFSTGPFWSLVFSIFSCSFFLFVFNHSFLATKLSTCFSRSANIFAGFNSLLFYDPIISFEDLLLIVCGIFGLLIFSKKFWLCQKHKQKINKKIKSKFVAFVSLWRNSSEWEGDLEPQHPLKI